MKGSNVKNLILTSYDDIFQTDECREEAGHEKVMEIPLTELHSFKNHPFKVKDDDAMQDMVESVKKSGILVPIVARPDGNGGYELIAGHRRKRACELAGIETMPVLLRNLDDDEAVLVMVDSNIQREELLFSEKAYAYKMKMDAIKRQAGRPPRENSSQIGVHSFGSKSYEIIGEQVGESKNQVFRYIRLTELIHGLMEMVDGKKISFNPAVELSYLSNEEQELLLDAIAKEEATPSLSQAQRMKKFSQEGKLTGDVINAIMCEQKKDDIKVTFTSSHLKKYFPASSTPQEMEKIIIRLLENWHNRKQQQN